MNSLPMLGAALAALCGSAGGALLITPHIRDFALRHSLFDPIGKVRDIHTRPVPRLGGVAIYTSFISTVGILLIFSAPYHLPAPYTLRAICAILISATLIFVLGLYDDIRSLSPYWKIAVESLAGVFLYMAGFGIHRMDLLGANRGLNDTLSLLLTILWVLLITNAFNLIDGLDGLAAGSALFSTVVMFGLALSDHNLVLGFATLVLAGAIFGFLRFNFYPASIFLGDSGSLFIGFLLSAFALIESQKSTTAIAVAIPVAAFGLPILDVTIAILRRFLSGKPLLLGDSDHIHHRLLKRGLSQRDAVVLLYLVTTGFGLLSLSLLHGGRLRALILGVTGIAIWLGIRYLRYAEFSEVRRALAGFLQQRQMLANNCAVQRAVELLDSCSDVETLCEILRETLVPLGIDGLSFSILSLNGFSEVLIARLRRDANGRLWLQWKDNPINTWSWELHFELTAARGVRYGHLSLYRLSCDQPLLVDINLLASSFQKAISGAITRAATHASSTLTTEEPVTMSPPVFQVQFLGK